MEPLRKSSSPAFNCLAAAEWDGCRASTLASEWARELAGVTSICPRHMWLTIHPSAHPSIRPSIQRCWTFRSYRAARNTTQKYTQHHNNPAVAVSLLLIGSILGNLAFFLVVFFKCLHMCCYNALCTQGTCIYIRMHINVCMYIQIWSNIKYTHIYIYSYISYLCNF